MIKVLGWVTAALAVTVTNVALQGHQNHHDYVHDGRFASCHIITEDGVTDHLAEFAARCNGGGAK